MHVFVLKGDSICTVGVIAPEMGDDNIRCYEDD